ncbi:tetrathionate reductase subunit TtrB [Pluralibacter sp.]|uniref:tetrathionate reductase subunit TtrB n=1 Tax=Pluralibacter sp. TaxID=1920032 RepID=UPI0025D99109|nr:tetrathionate reductase subunit TtrB [Pluralibacter sp.]MBV8043746.1 tetrathionate reductase subunit TtrB [Pluralibacter sp.]
MDISKRQFLQQLGVITAGASLVPLAQASISLRPERREGSEQHRYAMLIDLRRCIGCQSCTVSCAIENQTPQGAFRTTVNQYQVRLSGRDEVTNVLLPRLCNHCDSPPCVPVCPVQATFQRKDGIVVIDNTRCVGCAYCVQACPYDARFINHDTQTADKCTFCAHRLEAGLLPACVESCVGGARMIGDLKDPASTISRMLAQHHAEVKVLKPENNTQPQVFYLGLDEAFVTPLQGHAQPALWQEVI